MDRGARQAWGRKRVRDNLVTNDNRELDLT